MQNDKHPPPLDPNLNKSQPVRNDQEEDQKTERLWKHESEVPDPLKEATENTESERRTDSN